MASVSVFPIDSIATLELAHLIPTVAHNMNSSLTMLETDVGFFATPSSYRTVLFPLESVVVSKKHPVENNLSIATRGHLGFAPHEEGVMQ